jgi:hypothetical protein
LALAAAEAAGLAPAAELVQRGRAALAEEALWQRLEAEVARSAPGDTLEALARRRLGGGRALEGLVQGLGYLGTRRLDLSAGAFGTAIPAEELVRVAERCPEVEALFVPAATALPPELVRRLGALCPRARCLALGEILMR